MDVWTEFDEQVVFTGPDKSFSMGRDAWTTMFHPAYHFGWEPGNLDWPDFHARPGQTMANDGRLIEAGDAALR